MGPSLHGEQEGMKSWNPVMDRWNDRKMEDNGNKKISDSEFVLRNRAEGRKESKRILIN